MLWGNSLYSSLMAGTILQREVPDLLEILQQKGLADQVGLLEHATSAVDERSDSLEQENLYFSMHSILARICEGKASSWQGRNTAGILASLNYVVFSTLHMSHS